ncbi:putative protein OS=Ureibacillus acetophenoni OX=614649 GN=SAMN05877842_105149 PE=4 SV=1 [Ureibacillus acetophenoni]
MSKENMNNTGVNCTNSNNGASCKLEQNNSKQNDVEFASEFNPNFQSEGRNNQSSFTGNEYEPNKERTPSERTAWN